MNKIEILDLLPCVAPYRYVDKIISVNEHRIVGTYKFKDEEYFYKGHFPNNPVTPGAILLESASQLGLLAFGIYLMKKQGQKFPENFYLVHCDVSFKKIIKPTQEITIISEKIFFRFNKLKCKVHIKSPEGEIICKGIISGMKFNEKIENE